MKMGVYSSSSLAILCFSLGTVYMWRKTLCTSTAVAYSSIVAGILFLWLKMVYGTFNSNSNSTVLFATIPLLILSAPIILGQDLPIFQTCQQKLWNIGEYNAIATNSSDQFEDSQLDESLGAISQWSSTTAASSEDGEDWTDHQGHPALPIARQFAVFGDGKGGMFPHRPSTPIKRMCPPDPCTAPSNEQIELPQSQPQKAKLEEGYISPEEETVPKKVTEAPPHEDKLGKAEPPKAPTVKEPPKAPTVKEPPPAPSIIPAKPTSSPETTITDKSLAIASSPDTSVQELPFDEAAAANTPCGVFILEDHLEWIVYERRKKVIEILQTSEELVLDPEQARCIARIKQAAESGHPMRSIETTEDHGTEVRPTEEPLTQPPSPIQSQKQQPVRLPPTPKPLPPPSPPPPPPQPSLPPRLEDGKKKKEATLSEPVENGSEEESVPEPNQEPGEAAVVSSSGFNIELLIMTIVLVSTAALIAYFASRFDSFDEFIAYVKELLKVLLDSKIAMAVLGLIIIAAIVAYMRTDQEDEGGAAHKAVTHHKTYMQAGGKEHFKITYEVDIPEENWLAYKNQHHSFFTLQADGDSASLSMDE